MLRNIVVLGVLLASLLETKTDLAIAKEVPAEAYNLKGRYSSYRTSYSKPKSYTKTYTRYSYYKPSTSYRYKSYYYKPKSRTYVKHKINVYINYGDYGAKWNYHGYDDYNGFQRCVEQY